LAKEHKTVKEIWKKYLSMIGENINDTGKTYESWYFCNNEKDANELAGLVKKGIKRATASLYCMYEIENEPVPEVGDYVVITNWKGIAQCIIQITNINIIPFKEVTEEFAAKEGEGDKTLSFWRKVHRKFFTLALKECNKKFSEDMLVICEEFEVVYN
jgi:uncharacterized protein YhfF